MTKKYVPPPTDKKRALDDALYERDKIKAQKAYKEVKSYLTIGAREAVEKQIASLPANKPKKK